MFCLQTPVEKVAHQLSQGALLSNSSSPAVKSPYQDVTCYLAPSSHFFIPPLLYIKNLCYWTMSFIIYFELIFCLKELFLLYSSFHKHLNQSIFCHRYITTKEIVIITWFSRKIMIIKINSVNSILHWTFFQSYSNGCCEFLPWAPTCFLSRKL